MERLAKSDCLRWIYEVFGLSNRPSPVHSFEYEVQLNALGKPSQLRRSHRSAEGRL